VQDFGGGLGRVVGVGGESSFLGTRLEEGDWILTGVVDLEQD
jgi:hypothetical protein